MTPQHHATRRGLYRDTRRGFLFGVCAGISDWLDFPLWATRVITLALAWAFTLPVLAIYLVAAMLMPARQPDRRRRTFKGSCHEYHYRRNRP